MRSITNEAHEARLTIRTGRLTGAVLTGGAATIAVVRISVVAVLVSVPDDAVSAFGSRALIGAGIAVDGIAVVALLTGIQAPVAAVTAAVPN